MGWWREGNDLIGDGPADRVAIFVNDRTAQGPLELAEILGAIDKALRRNPAQFVADPASIEGQLAAVSMKGTTVWQDRDISQELVEQCHDVLEQIAMEYLDNSLETLPTCSELLGTFRFVLAPRLSDSVRAPAEFELRHIGYASGDHRVLRGLSLQCLEQVLADFDMQRDRDALPQGDPPAFASWTRHPDLSLEVDWHAPGDGPEYVEIRGSDAPRLASALIETCGGTPVRDFEDALVDLLTVPPRSSPASASAAQLRWETLCVTAAGEGVFDNLAGRALLAAGLADSDWRVRMTAIWAVGHHRIAGLAAKAENAALPKLGYKGLSQDDRRVFLALRDLAAARSAGRPDAGKQGANQGFVARVASLLDAVPETADTRANALIRALLRQPLPEDSVPMAWKLWMEPHSI